MPDKLQETALGRIVMVVCRQVSGKPVNPFCQQGYLHLGLTGVSLVGSVFADEFSLFSHCFFAQVKPLLFSLLLKISIA